MSFSTDIAALVAKQLSRFVTLSRHQLAGQAANLDFWLDQVRHALSVIDGYGVRFVRMHGAQEEYVAAHDTKTFTLGADYPTEAKASPPRRIPDHEMRKARRELVEATVRFLERCRSDGLISESQMSEARASFAIE